MKFCIKEGKIPSVFSQHFLCIGRISIRIFVILRKNILIKFMIEFLVFPQRPRFSFLLMIHYSSHFFQKSSFFYKKVTIRLCHCFLFQDLSDPLSGKLIPLHNPFVQIFISFYLRLIRPFPSGKCPASQS